MLTWKLKDIFLTRFVNFWFSFFFHKWQRLYWRKWVTDHLSKKFCTRTATNTPFLNRGHALAFYIFQWKVFKFWSCLNLKSGEFEASNCKLQGIAEVSGSELLNTGSLQHTRVSWWNGSPLLWLLSEFHPSEFTADGFNQNTDRSTASHNKAVRVVTLLHNMLYAFVEYTVIPKANPPPLASSRYLQHTLPHPISKC